MTSVFEVNGKDCAAGLYQHVKSAVMQIVVLLDVEFLPPEELPRIFSVQTEYQSTLVFLYNNAVIVLPAFEVTERGAEGQDLAVKLARGKSPCGVQQCMFVLWWEGTQ